MTEWLYCPQCRQPLFEDAGTDGRPLTCPQGHFRKYDNPVATTIGVIEHDGRYLLLKRARDPERDRWDAVGGFIQGAESPKACLVREALEETGLHIEPTRLLGVYSSVYGDTGLTTVGIAYLCEIAGDALEVRLSEENSEHGWFEPASIPDLAFDDVRAAYAALRPS